MADRSPVIRNYLVFALVFVTLNITLVSVTSQRCCAVERPATPVVR